MHIWPGMTSSCQRPWKRYRDLIKSYPGQKESAGSVNLAKEVTASAYSTNTHQGVSTKVKNTNTIPAAADKGTAETVAHIDGLPVTIRYATEEAPYRPFLWAAEFPNMTFYFETKVKAAVFVDEQLRLHGAPEFVSPRPAWATDTDSNSLSGHGDLICIHMATMAEGATWSVDIQRIDTQTPAGVEIGPVEVIPTNSETPLTVDELLAFSAALAAAAVQLAVLNQ